MDNIVEHLDIQLQYFQTILCYLDNSGNLCLIKAQCDKYKKTKGLVYTFKILIDPSKLCEADAYLGNLLLKQPRESTKIFQEILYKIILVLDLLPCKLSLSQVAVILRCSALPILPDLNIIRSAACLSRVYNSGIFCHLVGVVTGISAISKYTQSARYFCPDEGCEGYNGNHFIRVHIPGASEAETIRRDFKCTFCCTTLTEEKSSRALSDRIVAEVIPEEVMSQTNIDSNQRSRGQAIPVYIRDDLTKCVEIGDCCEILGTIRKDIQEDKITMMIEVNNIKKVRKQASAEKLLQEIPRNVLSLYKDRKTSPWSFVLTLAYLFGGEICPQGTYFNLKFAMLLSIMSHLGVKTKPVHLLAIGADTEILSRLLRFGQRFKDNSTTLTAGHSLTGQVILDRYNSAPYFVEGGILHLSQGGICNVGDVHRLKKSSREQLQSALSSGKVCTNVGSKYTGGLPQHLEQPMGSRVWGYTDPTACKKHQQTDDGFIACDTGDLPKALLDVFGLLCFTDSGELSTSEETEWHMIDHTLVCATMQDAGTSIPLSTQDFHQFIKFADRLRPKYSKEAEILVHSYYLACRKSRQSQSTNVPVSAHQTLLSLAYSHAKLALRSEVTVNDALMAIKLYEESLTARLGFSVLSVQPIPHVTSSILNHCLGPENDKQMLQLHTNLLRYCSLASGLEE